MQEAMHNSNVGGSGPWAWRSWVAGLLCLVVFFTLSIQGYSHGPGAFAEGQRISAEIAAHGHAHGAPSHNAADHDHQTTEVAEALPATEPIPFGKPALRPGMRNHPDGLAMDGPRRPPRSVVL